MNINRFFLSDFRINTVRKNANKNSPFEIFKNEEQQIKKVAQKRFDLLVWSLTNLIKYESEAVVKRISGQSPIVVPTSLKKSGPPRIILLAAAFEICPNALWVEKRS
jgi:hypothetical protein